MKKIITFIKTESFAGIILIIAAFVAFAWANSDRYEYYFKLLNLSITIGKNSLPFTLPSTLLGWTNDGLMAIFFCLIGLEVKREIVDGNLSTLKQASLPLMAAIGGILFPAIIYIIMNFRDETALRGWAIPTATDIAFALAILSLFGSRLANSLRIFLLALAIFDDLAAIAIIALFYQHDGNLIYLLYAVIPLSILVALNYLKVAKVLPYLLTGVLLWVFILNSGVHATIAGVTLALFIPLSTKPGHKNFPLQTLEYFLHPWVAYFILPLFAFANSGISLGNNLTNYLSSNLGIGIILALFVGKQFGIFIFSWGMIKLKMAPLPKDSSWLQLYGIAVLGGIGFSMSMFIGILSFANNNEYLNAAKLGIICASLLSAIIGSIILYLSARRVKAF